MTRKDYVAVAKAFAELPNDAHKARAVAVFCAYALRDNPSFDVVKFKAAAQ